MKAAWFKDVLQAAVPARIQGRVWSIRGATVSAAGLSVPVGSVCEIRRGNGESLEAEVVGFEGDRTVPLRWIPVMEFDLAIKSS